MGRDGTWVVSEVIYDNWNYLVDYDEAEKPTRVNIYSIAILMGKENGLWVCVSDKSVSD